MVGKFSWNFPTTAPVPWRRHVVPTFDVEISISTDAVAPEVLVLNLPFLRLMALAVGRVEFGEGAGE